MRKPVCTGPRSDGKGACMAPATQRILIPGHVGFRCEAHKVEPDDDIQVFDMRKEQRWPA